MCFGTPSFKKFGEQNSVEQALNEVEALMAEDDLTSNEVWTAKYRQVWRDFLKALPSTGEAATFTPNMSPLP